MQEHSGEIKDVLQLLLVFRFVNALCVRTFFQPDEYFQALEPAWNLAFGDGSGAWLTWEWQYQLRSSLHPALFAAVYWLADRMMEVTQFFPAAKAYFIGFMPTVVIQSVFAALADFYTWRLAVKIYGDHVNFHWGALWMTVLNPWQCLPAFPAATAVILRPTNICIWWTVLLVSTTRMMLDGQSTLDRPSFAILVREMLLCGSIVVALSAISDRLYFGFWTFPPYNWLYFNVSQSLASFYGEMHWHYYGSQGVPLLTNTFLPFALAGLCRPSSLSQVISIQGANTLKTLSCVTLTLIATLSVIAHKEVRFIYPLLPLLHILAAPYFLSFFVEASSLPAHTGDSFGFRRGPRFAALVGLLVVNVLLAGYLTLAHQAAPLGVMRFLRLDFERVHPDAMAFGSSSTTITNTNRTATSADDELFVLFLTPCHSTPWRSHLVYPALRARALTCEPPLATAPGSPERAAYADETDRFFARDADGQFGARFLREELWPLAEGQGSADTRRRGGEKMPRYIVGFEPIEPVLVDFFHDGHGAGAVVPAGGALRRVWTGFNGFFNEDWKRQGRLVVWETGAYPGSAAPV
ncbi:hypothetical protein P8C59_006818 [Phyllachora maydis]|uniref:Mannosyltransferase n=1 Tax=Phyllachora maydis TaxID=1825666 RepID=A0AAD9MH98_9PEZI|nr:hypothetical protein P8C59_006818 [Phyllachora maydis]